MGAHATIISSPGATLGTISFPVMPDTAVAIAVGIAVCANAGEAKIVAATRAVPVLILCMGDSPRPNFLILPLFCVLPNRVGWNLDNRRGSAAAFGRQS